MDGDETGCGALAEAVVFLKFFEDLPDPRQRAKVVYPLDEILLLCLLAVLAGAETVTDMARFGEKKRAFLRRFRPFSDGTPTHDHLGDILASLDAQAFQRCFLAWVASLTGAPADVIAHDVIAIDGKTSRRSGSKTPLHTVSAFAARQRLVLGQVAVAEKSNEIVAIPKLLAMMAIEGAVVTIDAMGCQRDIARTILHNKADRLRPRPEGQPGHAKRRCRASAGRAEGGGLQGHPDQPPPDRRRRSRTHRDANHHRPPRCRLAQAAPRMARPERHRRHRFLPRTLRHDRARDPAHHHRAHGISRLPEVDGDKPKKQCFAGYAIGYVHIDMAEVSTGEGKLCLLVAIDRTSKFVFVRLVESDGKMEAAQLPHATSSKPCRIVSTQYLLTCAFSSRHDDGTITTVDTSSIVSVTRMGSSIA